MTQPHHHVFNALQQSINKSVQIKALLPHLVKNGVIPAADLPRYKSRSGMKILIGFLRNETFQDFLNFVECIFLAQRDEPSQSKAGPLVESMIKAVQDFDERNKKNFAEELIAIKLKYLSLQGGESSAVDEEVAGSSQAASAIQEPIIKGLFINDLPYVEEEPNCELCDSSGRTIRTKYGFSLTVPPLAVPDDQVITVDIRTCAYGPFSINENYLIASDFFVVAADGIFCTPVKVEMEHCLYIPEYRRCSEIVILKADHQSITDDGFYTFDYFTNPDLFSDRPVASFEIRSFCILCLALDSHNRNMLPPNNQMSIDDPAPSSYPDDNSSTQRATSSLAQHTACTTLGMDESLIPRLSTSQCENAEMREPNKRKRALMHEESSDECVAIKKACQIEYVALLFEPRDNLINFHSQEYTFVIFISRNCSGANEICKKQAERILDAPGTVAFAAPIPITFDSGSVQVIRFEVHDTSPDWTVDSKTTPTVSSSEAQFHMMDGKEIVTRISQNILPPRIVFTADYDGEDKMKKLRCKVFLKGATKTDTNDTACFTIRAKPPPYPFLHVGGFNLPLPSGLLRQDAVDIPNIPLLIQRNTPPSFKSNSFSSSLDGPRISFHSQDISAQAGVENTPPNPVRSLSGTSTDSLKLFCRTDSVSLSVDGKEQISLKFSSEGYVKDDEVTVHPPRTLEQYKSNFTTEELQKQLSSTDKIYLSTTRQIRKWKNVARNHFKFTEAEVDQLENDFIENRSTHEIIVQMFRRWKQQEGIDVISVSKLVEILYDAGEWEAIDFLVDYFHGDSQSTTTSEMS